MTPTDVPFRTVQSEREAHSRTSNTGRFSALLNRNTATDPYAAFMKNRNFSSLNGVRCLCCLLVIAVHTPLEFSVGRIFQLGWIGVDLFFGISGFLIVTLLLRERASMGGIGLKKFYVRRALRIFPVYYMTIFVVIAGSLLVSPWKPASLTLYLMALPWLLTYTMDFIGNHPGLFYQCYSLAMEEQFYQVWPAVEKYARGWRLWAVFGLMLLLNLGVTFGFFDGLLASIYGDQEAFKRPVFSVTFTPILLGVALAHGLNAPGPFRFLYRLVGYRLAPFVLLALIVAFCEVAPESLRGWPRAMVQALLTLLLTSLVVREDHWARPFLTLRPIARLGVVSYGMYVYHTWVWAMLFPICKKLGISSQIVWFVLVAFGTYLLAEASFRLMEEPLLRLKSKFGHSKRPAEDSDRRQYAFAVAAENPA